MVIGELLGTGYVTWGIVVFYEEGDVFVVFNDKATV